MCWWVQVPQKSLTCGPKCSPESLMTWWYSCTHPKFWINILRHVHSSVAPRLLFQSGVTGSQSQLIMKSLQGWNTPEDVFSKDAQLLSFCLQLFSCFVSAESCPWCHFVTIHAQRNFRTHSASMEVYVLLKSNFTDFFSFASWACEKSKVWNKLLYQLLNNWSHAWRHETNGRQLASDIALLRKNCSVAWE